VRRKDFSFVQKLVENFVEILGLLFNPSNIFSLFAEDALLHDFGQLVDRGDFRFIVDLLHSF
jgi:hypothetical protein